MTPAILKRGKLLNNIPAAAAIRGKQGGPSNAPGPALKPTNKNRVRKPKITNK